MRTRLVGRDAWRGKMKKLLCIVAAAMALIVASSTAMAEPKKRSDKATHRMKSPQPSKRVPTYEDRLREYQELKRQGWYKEDKA
jgi:ribulose kinase